MSLDLDPIARRDGDPVPDEAELDLVLRALAGGDPAFALTLIERFGDAIAAELRDGDVPAAELDARVHDVAFHLLGAPVDVEAEPWVAVRIAARRVAAEASRQDEEPCLLRGRITFGVTGIRG